jgi:hypothetical protein
VGYFIDSRDSAQWAWHQDATKYIPSHSGASKAAFRLEKPSVEVSAFSLLNRTLAIAFVSFMAGH